MQKRKNIAYIVFGCFFLSGLSALIFQTAWVKSLSLVFGTSYLAVATVLAAYMFGLAVGAFSVSKFLHKITNPVLFYGVLEGIIAATGLLVPVALDGFFNLYIFIFGGQPEPVVEHGLIQPLFFLLATFIVIAIPTVAMGATLPLLTKYIVTNDKTVGPGIGSLYFFNTIGAVTGVLLSGFLLLAYLGLYGSMGIASAVNLLIFVLTLYLFKYPADSQQKETKPSPPRPQVSIWHWRFYLSFFTGILSFSLEVFWTRLLSHIMGGTTYAFAIMLSSFLAGIAIGGYAGGKAAKSRDVASRLYPTALVLVAISSYLAYHILQSMELANDYTLLERAILSFSVLFPSAFFLGMTFPLLIKTIVKRPTESATITAISYSWNTFGAIIGSVATGFIVLPLMGFYGFIFGSVVAFCLLAISYCLLSANRSPTTYAAIFVPVIVVISLFPSGRPYSLLYAHINLPNEEVRTAFYSVGRTSTILLHEENGYFRLSSNGLSESAIGSKGMPPFNLSQKWLAGLPSLARPDAQHYAIVGLGGGIVLEGVPPTASTIDVFELEPLVTQANMAIAERRARDPLADPRVNVVENDARNALSLTSKKYDIVVSQPSHPWTGGASHLYTEEFLELVISKMNDDGVFLQWINSQFIDEKLFKVMTATLLNNFDYVELYQPERQVLMFVASNSPLDIWNGNKNAEKALEQSGAHYSYMGALSMEDVIAMLIMDHAGLSIIGRDSTVNTDVKNKLAYFTRPRSDGLNADDLFNLYGHLDPLLSGQGLLAQANLSISYPLLAEKLIQSNSIRRAEQLAASVDNHVHKLLIDAIGLEYAGNPDKARQLYRSALEIEPKNIDAQAGLLRLHLEDFSKLALSADIASLANKQSGGHRAVLEAWVLGATGRFEEMSKLDASLASVPPNSLFYPIAVKLRVDWRTWKTINTRNRLYAKEALKLLDSMLASFWNVDLYLLRFQVARQLQLPFHQFESLVAASEQILSDEPMLNRSDYRKKLILNGLSSIKEDDELEDYRERINTLLRRLDLP